MGATVSIIIQMFFPTCKVLKIGENHLNIPRFYVAEIKSVFAFYAFYALRPIMCE